ncbi:hypothetical protein PS718_02498 [Pseudomonas fluorescens]|uniref:Uncharacterized protein n=1 Tax=Pseudomonas fluorescens TaxID=294 RepID=A0A5E7C377_PSEFL|nr:hypothetical protein [Pseudomonas fluorescens]VVN98879.1 hypothetical protein PS718_02498 [Pseudomonas fluorescens]
MTVKSGLIGCVVLGGWLMAGQVFAACTPPAVAGQWDFSVCKDWPVEPILTINALSKFVADPVYANGDKIGSYDLDLSVVSADASTSLATYHQSSAFLTDAFALEAVELDTARYKLTPSLRAFGVRAIFKGSSSVNPLNETVLSLYVKEGDKLRPVLDRLLVYRFSGEWDGNCAGERGTTVRTIEMGKTSSHGFVDLIIKSVTTELTGEGPPDTCEMKTTNYKPELTTLRYDGRSYVLPNGFQGL